MKIVWPNYKLGHRGALYGMTFGEGFWQVIIHYCKPSTLSERLQVVWLYFFYQLKPKADPDSVSFSRDWHLIETLLRAAVDERSWCCHLWFLNRDAWWWVLSIRLIYSSTLLSLCLRQEETESIKFLFTDRLDQKMKHEHHKQKVRRSY